MCIQSCYSYRHVINEVWCIRIILYFRCQSIDLTFQHDIVHLIFYSVGTTLSLFYLLLNVTGIDRISSYRNNLTHWQFNFSWCCRLDFCGMTVLPSHIMFPCSSAAVSGGLTCPPHSSELSRGFSKELLILFLVVIASAAIAIASAQVKIICCLASAYGSRAPGCVLS